MSENDIDNEQDQKVMEFDFPMPLNDMGRRSNLIQRHDDIGKLLEVPDDNKIQHLFSTVTTLCDPFTQPEETEDYVLSLDCLSDLLIALSYTNFKNQEVDEADDALKNPDIRSVKFALSLRYFTLLQYVQRALNADDEIKLRYVNNTEDGWFDSLGIWTPKKSIANDEFALKICYSISCVLLLAICKLFKPENGEDYNLALNPYLQYFIKLWKCHTNIIILGLEIDRRLELDQAEETPFIVTQVLKGSSAIRYVLAWTLNQNPSSLAFYGYDELSPDANKSLNDADFDIKGESLINFSQPVARKKVNGGSLSIDMRLVIIALLIINSGITFTTGQKRLKSAPHSGPEGDRMLNQAKPIAELGDLLIDLEYDDQFDEDIRYIFECEFEDVEDEWSDVVDEEESKKIEPIDSNSKVVNPDNKDKEKTISTAVRTKQDVGNIEFDEFGHDWRDVPRDENASFHNWFLQMVKRFEDLPEKEKGQSDDILYSWDELQESFDFLITTSIEGDTEAEEKIGQVLINTISKAVKDELETESEKSQISNTPDRIYQYWSASASEMAIQATQNNNKLIVPIFNVTNFELLLHNNSKLARCLMDEMLMCQGYRRVLIWFITHNLNLSTLLIDYVFELLVGLRGNKERQTPYKFTRKGENLVLSEIERSMLLHEFLTNSSVYLSATDGIEIDDGYKVVLSDSIAKKYMTLICLMINQLINVGVIDLEKTISIKDRSESPDDIHDYSNDLQVLLINWIGKLPEARELFFKVKKANYDAGDVAETPSTDTTAIEGADTQGLQILVDKYSSMASIEISEDLENNKTNIAILSTFSRCLEQHIKTVINKQLDVKRKRKSAVSTDLIQLASDFTFFLQNFNTLCKIDYFAEQLFNGFETLATTGDFGYEEEEPEPEFNDQFLNGEGKFNDNRMQDASKSSKKKKNKKKKKKNNK